jgi:hypothetical protein
VSDDIILMPKVGVTLMSPVTKEIQATDKMKEWHDATIQSSARVSKVESTQPRESELLINRSMDNSAIFWQETAQKSDTTGKGSEYHNLQVEAPFVLERY